MDSASSASFVSEHLVQTLCLLRSYRGAKISGVAGLTHNSPLQSIASLRISAVCSQSKKIDVTAVVVPRVTCGLQLHPIPFNIRWKHFEDITLSDPYFRRPGRIDLQLGVDVFVEVFMHGRWTGLLGAPIAFETLFSCGLAGKTDAIIPDCNIVSHHVSFITGDDLLRKFSEIEEHPQNDLILLPEERSVVSHFRDNHTRTDRGRLVVPLPKRLEATPLGESRSQAVCRFLLLDVHYI